MRNEDGLNTVTDEEIAEVKESHKGAKLCKIEVDLDDGRYYEGLFFEPSSAIVQRFIAKTNGQKNDGTTHSDNFVRDCLTVSPTQQEYFSLLETMPALSLSISAKLIEGHGLADNSKKKSV